MNQLTNSIHERSRMARFLSLSSLIMAPIRFKLAVDNSFSIGHHIINHSRDNVISEILSEMGVIASIKALKPSSLI